MRKAGYFGIRCYQIYDRLLGSDRGKRNTETQNFEGNRMKLYTKFDGGREKDLFGDLHLVKLINLVANLSL